MPLRNRSQVLPRTVWTVAFHVLAILAVLFVIHRTRQVGWWILIAIFVALATDPLVCWLERHRIKRGFGVTGVLVGFLVVGTLVLGTLIPVLVEQGTILVQSVPDMLDRLRGHSFFQWADSRFGLIQRAKAAASGSGAAAAGPVMRVVEEVFTAVIALITIIALTVFMLLFGNRLFEGALQWVAPVQRPRLAQLAEDIRRSVGGYVAGAMVIALIGGVVTGVATALLAVPYFLPLGMTMAILGVIPFVGSVVGGTLVVTATFLSSGSKAGLIALVIFVVYQQVENHVLQPLIQRKTIRMSPLVIAVVMLIGTALWGLVGALLALPIAGVIQVVLQVAL